MQRVRAWEQAGPRVFPGRAEPDPDMLLHFKLLILLILNILCNN